MKLFEHDGRYFRRLADDEIVQVTDLVSIFGPKGRWGSTGRAGETVASVRSTINPVDYFREVEPLVAAMIKAKESNGNL